MAFSSDKAVNEIKSLSDKSDNSDEDFKNKLTLQMQCERKLADHLKSITQCKASSLGTVHCKLSYNELKMEFAGVDRGGTIYVYSLGRDQVLSTFGRRCISISFNELCEVDAPNLLFFEDGNITNRSSNEAAWRACD